MVANDWLRRGRRMSKFHQKQRSRASSTTIAPPKIYKPTFDFSRIISGDARTIIPSIPSGSVDLSFWSPPYYVGKSYERDWSFSEWQSLMEEVIALHSRVLKPGGFLAINIGDILCFPDESMPATRRTTYVVRKVQLQESKLLS